MTVLVVAMVLAACWGVLQLAVLASPTRSVRLATLVLAVGAGAYACGIGALAVQLAWTRLLGALTGDSAAQIARWASYTVDPFIEEVAKVVPLVVLGLVARSRLQRGLTDYVLLGAALGAGFGLLEAMMRFGTRAGSAMTTDGGWVIPLSLSPPFVPAPSTVLGQWLPAPVGSTGFLSLWLGSGPNQHLVWSAIAGLGVGLTVRGRGLVRLAGPIAVLLVGADHAANNYALGTPAGLGTVAATVHTALDPFVGFSAFAALVVAVVLDLHALGRAPAGEMRLARERRGPAVLSTTRAAMVGVPWSLVLVLRLVLTRRAARYSGDGAPEVESLARRLDAVDSAGAWRRAPVVELGRLRGWWPLALWALLLAPAAAYYLLGSTPRTAGVQAAMSGTVPFVVLLVLPAVVGTALLAWVGVRLARALPAALRGPDGDLATRVVLRLGASVGGTGLGVLGLVVWAGGARADGRLVSGLHVLDALDLLLLAGGIALLIAAFVFFPPSIGLVGLATGSGAVLVPTIAVSGAFVTTTVAGSAMVVLSQVEGTGGGDQSKGSSSGSSNAQPPDVPQKPPRPKPEVRNWRLRNIVRDLWKGTENPNRVGDGTTMDAVRNELATGRPTEGTFHSTKAQESVNALNNWIQKFSSGATRQDVQWAYRLRAELQNALSSGLPGGG